MIQSARPERETNMHDPNQSLVPRPRAQDENSSALAAVAIAFSADIIGTIFMGTVVLSAALQSMGSSLSGYGDPTIVGWYTPLAVFAGFLCTAVGASVAGRLTNASRVKVASAYALAGILFSTLTVSGVALTGSDRLELILHPLVAFACAYFAPTRSQSAR